MMSELTWVEDSYTVLAGDAAAGYMGRAFNLDKMKWETVSGGNMTRSVIRPYFIRMVDLRVSTAGGAGRCGILTHLNVIGDPLATYRRIALPNAQLLLKGDDHARWAGRFPLLAGFEYHITLGGVIATDVVHCQIGWSL